MNFAQRITASWFEDLSGPEQEKYIKNHPNSKFAKEAEADEGTKSRTQRNKFRDIKDSEARKAAEKNKTPGGETKRQISFY